MRLAIQCFEQAIQLDPEFALAYGGLADCYAILRVYGFIRHDEGQGRALAALTKATAAGAEVVGGAVLAGALRLSTSGAGRNPGRTLSGPRGRILVPRWLTATSPYIFRWTGSGMKR